MTQSQDVGLERTRLAKIALAAWCNLDPDQLPPTKEWIEHPSDVNRQAWDRVVEAVSAEVRQAAEARAEALEVALETFAIMANEDTDDLDDEHVVRLFFSDPQYDGEDTLLGERFMRAFRRARALLPHVCGEGEVSRSQPCANGAPPILSEPQHSDGGRNLE
jgi:hypothetical protein